MTDPAPPDVTVVVPSEPNGCSACGDDCWRCGRPQLPLDPSYEHIVRWAIEQTAKRRKLVALIPPSEAPQGPRYAGYYCEDAPEN